MLLILTPLRLSAFEAFSIMLSLEQTGFDACDAALKKLDGQQSQRWSTRTQSDQSLATDDKICFDQLSWWRQLENFVSCLSLPARFADNDHLWLHTKRSQGEDSVGLMKRYFAVATVSKVHYLVFQVDVRIFWQSSEGCTAVQDPRWPPSAPLEADQTRLSWNTMSKLMGANFVEPSKYLFRSLQITLFVFCSILENTYLSK